MDLIQQLASLSQKENDLVASVSFKDMFLELKSIIGIITKNNADVDIDIYSYKPYEGVYTKLFQVF